MPLSQGRDMPSAPRRKQKNTSNKRASLAMVAAHANVSTATASRIINGITNKASEQTILQVKKAVEELGYRPASVGRALRCQESRMVGVLAASLANPAMSAIASSIELALRGRVTLCPYAILMKKQRYKTNTYEKCSLSWLVRWSSLVPFKVHF
ncbi:LacI family DNA-binding transcriptional regulator [Marinomonas sp. RS-M-Aa-14]|uniref:LacI family DNA-binding transcriptional regulator n=1 Tax=Marinomonas TaxID=28253 RepID=UPI003AAC3BA8